MEQKLDYIISELKEIRKRQDDTIDLINGMVSLKAKKRLEDIKNCSNIAVEVDNRIEYYIDNFDDFFTKPDYITAEKYDEEMRK